MPYFDIKRSCAMLYNLIVTSAAIIAGFIALRAQVRYQISQSQEALNHKIDYYLREIARLEDELEQVRAYYQEEN